MFRLHIDIPIELPEDMAIETSKFVMRMLIERLRDTSLMHDVHSVNYRLGHDDDRQKSNYLDKNENGHVSNRKNREEIQ